MNQGKRYDIYLWYKSACQRCGKEFRHNKPAGKYCSNACKQAAYRERKQWAKS